jgi:DNA-nicking Smr family endonuclease
MARRRDLDPEERALWQAVASTVTPNIHRRSKVALPPAQSPLAPTEPPRVVPKLPAFRLGEKSMPKHARPAESPLRMDAKTHDRMTRGKLAPEARIDLHGMTLAEAHGELIHFILGAQEQGYR